MMTDLTVGSLVEIPKSSLQQVVQILQDLGYRVIGPRVESEAVIYDDLESVQQIPVGVLDHQDGGKYRLQQTDQDAWFDYVCGPHSLKNFLFPPRQTVLESTRQDGVWEMKAPDVEDAPPLAVIGPRSCDLHALRVQDRVFLEGAYVDPSYQARREKLFIAAVNCRRAAATCFCHSMQTGPAVSSGFDLALTELDDRFVIEIGSQRGAEVMGGTDCSTSPPQNVQAARSVSEQLEQSMHDRSQHPPEAATGEPRGRWLDTSGIRDLLMHNLEHARWNEVAERCLACANCTMVCPTCFCSSVEEVADLSGDHVARERSWDSCFTAEHSTMSGGAVHKSTKSRYRQWLTHKLATWHDQFEMSGCVGCGRCITWCPVGIDLTEETAAIRADSTNPSPGQL
ncbi:4Fe-4S dicluster domain-containing protein [Lignipirellula cremea]|uniref:Anaerobic sulfite reductase subunit A n=1 Tax=Lignipirellula cremea TaxID=2528010 RepID=A0A518E466_9BACT|nr:4Fe-4S dicluster domain-containing protein [Lignipirellula cremea]QDU98872.1 Anaerobic sulfite reductase subunit A [Lignipirellula cremea]